MSGGSSVIPFLKKFETKNIACPLPYRHLHIYEGGNASFCCYSWQPHFIGNVNQNTVLEILQTSKAKKIQESVTFGNFKYCRDDLCPALVTYVKQNKVIEPLSFKQADPHRKKLTLYLNYDKSCNLACSSCRNDLIFYKKKNMPESLRRTHEAVLLNIRALLEDGYDLSLNITGSGDAFASELYNELMNEMATKSSIHFCIQTNGLLMNEQNISAELFNKIRWINVSVDAVRPDTYAKVRRGGRWSVLLKNLQWMNDHIMNHSSNQFEGWQFNFIVQEDNYLEIPEFLDWALKFNSKPLIWFNLIDDWGHLPRHEFYGKAIWRKNHPHHSTFLNTLRKLPMNHPQVIYGNMLNYMSSSQNTDTLSLS